MSKQQVDYIKNTVSRLIGQSLYSVSLAADMICFQFGESVTVKGYGRDESGKLVRKNVERGKYALHLQTFCRVRTSDEILFASGDVYQPNSTLEGQEDFDWEAFDWSVKGSNRFEEAVERHFQKPSEIIVKQVSANKFGDLKITFENGYILEVMPRVSSGEECWRFFEAGADHHLVVTGLGIDEEG